MNLQDMLDEYINYKIEAVLDVALANKEKNVTAEIKAVREWFSEFESSLDEIRSLADENEYNLERSVDEVRSLTAENEEHGKRLKDLEDGDVATRISALEEGKVELNDGVLNARIKAIVSKLKLTME